MKALFVELPAFAKYRADYLDDDGFGKLQAFLLKNPEAGDVIEGTGGLRKLRQPDGDGETRGRDACVLSDELRHFAQGMPVSRKDVATAARGETFGGDGSVHHVADVDALLARAGVRLAASAELARGPARLVACGAELRPAKVKEEARSAGRPC